jgi:hypothetical protein
LIPASGVELCTNRRSGTALCAPAAGAARLIFIGNHSAWDVVTFPATGQAPKVPDEPGRELALRRDE